MTFKGIVSEVPNEVLFCHAIASGNLQHAQALYPQVDLFKKNDLGITAALFCSWAAYENDSHAAINILQNYFPDLREQKKDPSKVDIAQTLLKVVLPKETSSSHWVAKLLMNISAVDPDKSAGNDQNQRFVFTCCVAALKFILDFNHGAFDSLTPKTRQLAQKLLHCQWLRPYAEEDFQAQSDKNHSEPASLQALMALLDDEATATAAEAAFLNLNRNYLMSGGPRNSYVNQAAKDLKTCRQECESENQTHSSRLLGPVN